MSGAFLAWRGRCRAASGRAKALTAAARVPDRRRFERAEMRLALKTWRRNACGGGGGGGAVAEEGLEAVAGVFVEAAAAFSTASSVRTGKLWDIFSVVAARGLKGWKLSRFSVETPFCNA